MQNNMVALLIQGILIGIIFGIPAGAVGALSLQRAMKYGFVAGLVTGLGSTVVDLFYAAIGLLGFTGVQGIINAWHVQVSICGGILVIILGIYIFKAKSEIKKERIEKRNLIPMFGSSFLIALFNPATIVSFLAIFSMLQLQTGNQFINGIGLIVGIGIGTCIWWVAISMVGVHLREKIAEELYYKLNRMMGIALIVFGVIVLIRGALS